MTQSDEMNTEKELQEVIDMVSEWDPSHQQKFYQLFPQTVRRETRYDLMGFQQHEED